MNSDFSDLLRNFEKFGVEYLVVGGYAVMYYAEPRYTKDLDVWIRSEAQKPARPENLSSLGREDDFGPMRKNSVLMGADRPSRVDEEEKSGPAGKSFLIGA